MMVRWLKSWFGAREVEGSILMKYSLNIFEIFLTCGFRVLGQPFMLNILLATDSVLYYGKVFLVHQPSIPHDVLVAVTSLFTLAPSVY
jgi:hypothetical protein